MLSVPYGRAGAGAVAHLFPGQGDFALTPLLRMLPAVPSLARELTEVFEEADPVAAEYGIAPIGPRLVTGRPLSTSALAAEPAGTVQLALFATSLAVHRALERDGWRAERLVAVSFGEIPALTAAGCCSIADGARLACRLGQLLTGHGGGMTLVGAGLPVARRLLTEAGSQARAVVVACVNHDGESVLSGPLDALAAVERLAVVNGVGARRLRLPFMSHHPALAREAGAFAHFARGLRLVPPRRPVHSVVAGHAYRPDSDLPKALSACLVRPFSLPAVLGAALADVALVVEAGTGATVTNSVRSIDPRQGVLAPVADGRWPAGPPDPQRQARSAGSARSGSPSRPDLGVGHGGGAAAGAELSPDAVDVPTRLRVLLGPGRGGDLARLLSRAPDGTDAAGTDTAGVDSAGADTAPHRRLIEVAAFLPPAAEVVADADLLAVLGEATALADPALHQTFLSHYTLCVGSLVLLGGGPDPVPSADAAPGASEAPVPGADLAHARTKGSFMVTELGDASSHLAIATEARFDPVRRLFTLHTPHHRAAKFSSVAATGLPQQAVVCARLLTGGRDAGVFSFLADITGPDGRPAPGVGLSGAMPLGALPLPYALVRFDGAAVPYGGWLADGAVIDAAGTLHDPQPDHDARLRRTLGCGAGLWATLPSAMAALAGRSAVMVLHFSADRRAHGRLAPGAPLLEYRVQQQAVVGALATAAGLRRCARAALTAWKEQRAAPDPDRSGAAPGADSSDVATAMTFSPWAAVDRSLALHKAHSTRTAAELIGSLQHRCGVSGFLDRNRLSGYLGLARAFDNAGGDNTLILLDAGRALAEEPGHRAPGGGGPRGPWPAPTDPAWWPHTAAALQDRLAADLRAALARRTKAGHRGLDLWNPLMAQALQLGEVQAARLAADAATHPGTAPRDLPGADDLAALDGLRQARRLAVPLLATGVLEPAALRDLSAAVDALCERLRPGLADIAAALDPGATLAPAPLDGPDPVAVLLAAHGGPSGEPGDTP
ncbi:acyltransferase domain-containing protein [Kitasatospora sp. NPDC094019]|uniref:acyltransferase domain-containing protein n=1 Tax=Kitasatospora sp. NPDC094019 TaxID=3364091 RepID=UPI0037F605B3